MDWRIVFGAGTAILVVGFFGLLGWGMSTRAEYRDLSSLPEYAARIGERCTVLRELRAHGFTLDLRRKDLTDEVDVTTLPGIDGPEITFVTVLPKDTVLVIEGARSCSNCPLENSVSYRVAIPQVEKLATYPIFARSEALASPEAKCVRP